MASEKTMDWADGIAFYLDVGCGHATEETVRGDIADMLRQTREKALEEAAKVADEVDLPDGYQWGREAKDNFYFGKDRAACAIRALAPPTVKAGEGE